MTRQPNKSLRELQDARAIYERYLNRYDSELTAPGFRVTLAQINAEIARRVGTYNHATGYREARRGSR